jgi:hypothetical protein
MAYAQAREPAEIAARAGRTQQRREAAVLSPRENVLNVESLFSDSRRLLNIMRGAGLKEETAFTVQMELARLQATVESENRVVKNAAKALESMGNPRAPEYWRKAEESLYREGSESLAAIIEANRVHSMLVSYHSRFERMNSFSAHRHKEEGPEQAKAEKKRLKKKPGRRAMR